jgi:hypothetical protein
MMRAIPAHADARPSGGGVCLTVVCRNRGGQSRARYNYAHEVVERERCYGTNETLWTRRLIADVDVDVNMGMGWAWAWASRWALLPDTLGCSCAPASPKQESSLVTAGARQRWLG